MIILAIALSVALFFGLATYLLFGLLASIFPFIVAFVATYFLIGRKIGKQLEQAMMQAQSEMQKGRIDQGIAILEKVKKQFANWQFFTKSSIDGQIGSIYFMRKDFVRAKPYLEQSFSRHWIAQAMLGVLYYRKKDFEHMNKTFERAARYSPKQGLLWSLWAYCLHNEGKDKEAIKVLAEGKEKLGESDKNLIENLLSLQNGKKMKMRGYGDLWYQFHLEIHPAMKQMQAGRVRFR